jgi:hypothetical protein
MVIRFYGQIPTNARCPSLAYTELYLALATVFRHFEFELYDTDVSDIELAHDSFLSSPKLDSKGVRVKATSIVS